MEELLPEDYDAIEKKEKHRKIFILIGGVFMILLVTSYFLTGYGVREIIVSLASSDVIEEGLIEEANVEIDDEVYQKLLEIYNEDLAVEIKVCLLGELEDDLYSVTSLVEPEIYSASFNQVVSEACPDETIIGLHSHPYWRCIASQQDLNNLEKAQEINPNIIMGIMCDEDRFLFYR
tara:strand:- start:927 stop:1457 length:531 start_codon:yes stop_codon:yes gene_type:complete